MNSGLTSLKRLKDYICNYLNKSYSDKIKIYNYKAVEIDDADIGYLQNNQVLYVSLDGK